MDRARLMIQRTEFGLRKANNSEHEYKLEFYKQFLGKMEDNPRYMNCKATSRDSVLYYGRKLQHYF